MNQRVKRSATVTAVSDGDDEIEKQLEAVRAVLAPAQAQLDKRLTAERTEIERLTLERNALSAKTTTLEAMMPSQLRRKTQAEEALASLELSARDRRLASAYGAICLVLFSLLAGSWFLAARTPMHLAGAIALQLLGAAFGYFVFGRKRKGTQ